MAQCPSDWCAWTGLEGIPTCRGICSPCSKNIQHVQKETVGGQQRSAGVHQEPSCSQRETAILDGKSVAKFDGNTVTKVKCPSSLSRDNQFEGPNPSFRQGARNKGKSLPHFS